MALDVNALIRLSAMRDIARRRLQAARQDLDNARVERDAAQAAIDKIDAALATVPDGLILDSVIPASATLDQVIDLLDGVIGAP